MIDDRKKLRFLADESCDFTVVKSLRAGGYDVVAVAESFSGAPDIEILRAAVKWHRILIMEDGDFGEWVFAHKEESRGVIFIRFPANIRSKLGETIKLIVDEYSEELIGNFTVVEPGRVRIRKFTHK